MYITLYVKGNELESEIELDLGEDVWEHESTDKIQIALDKTGVFEEGYEFEEGDFDLYIMLNNRQVPVTLEEIKILSQPEHDGEVVEALEKNEDMDTVCKILEERCYGFYDNGADYARQFCNDVGYVEKNTPDLLLSNIDWSGVWDDLSSDVEYVEMTQLGRNGRILVYETNF